MADSPEGGTRAVRGQGWTDDRRGRPRLSASVREHVPDDVAGTGGRDPGDASGEVYRGDPRGDVRCTPVGTGSNLRA